MTKDIVTRLRAETYYNLGLGEETSLHVKEMPLPVCVEAADEIERLRQQLAEHRLPGDGGDDTISDQTS